MKIFINTVTQDLEPLLITCEIQPTDSIDEVLAEYALSLGNHQKPDYLEAVFIVGRDVPLDGEKTFAQCAINVGDKVHALVQIIQLGLNILINSVLTKENLSIDAFPTTTVGELKKVIVENQLIMTSKYSDIPPSQLMLKLNDSLLEDEKMLKDYHILEGTTLELCPKYHTIFVHLECECERIEKFVVRPEETILEVKNKVTDNIETLYGAAGTLYKPIIRGVVKNANGEGMYLDLDLFCQLFVSQMRICVDKSDARSASKFCLFVSDDDKIEDVYTQLEHWQGQFLTLQKSRRDWPRGLNYQWATALLPQIEVEATLLHERKDLILYVVPQGRRITSLNRVSSCETIGKVRAMVCKNEGIKAKRVLCCSGSPLLEQRFVYSYHEMFDDQFLLSLMRPQVHVNDGQRIFVHVIISSRVAPIEFQHDSSDTIHNCKDTIQYLLAVPICMQKLYNLCGELIDDTRILNGLGIKKGLLVLQLRI